MDKYSELKEDGFIENADKNLPLTEKYSSLLIHQIFWSHRLTAYPYPDPF